MKKTNPVGFPVLLGAFLVVSTVSSAYGASFECSKASKPLEKLICSNPELDSADGAMGAAYKEALQSVPLKGFVALNQRWFNSGYGSCMVDKTGKVQTDPPAVHRCITAAKYRTEELRSFLTAKFYSNTSSKFTQEDLAILNYVKNGKSMVKLWGNWMPDAYQPKPFPNGVICDIDAELTPTNGGFKTESTDEAIFKFTDNSASIRSSIMCSPRTGIAEGDYKRSRN